jgi:transposase
MGWAYSVDLRERVVAAFDRARMTDQEAAALFKIGEATVRRWKRLKRETGALVRRPGGGGNPPRVAPDQYDVVRAILERGRISRTRRSRGSSTGARAAPSAGRR